MRIDYTRIAAKSINSLDAGTKRRILIGITGLTEIPPRGDIKLLQGGYPEKTFRLRIGKYRLIFRYKNDDDGSRFLIVEDVGLRGNFYD